MLLFYQGAYNPIRIISASISEPYLLRLFEGSFLLIEYELSQTKPDSLRTRFEQIKSVNGNKLELIKPIKADLSFFEKRRLKSGQTILLAGTPDRLARILPNTDLLIVMYIDEQEEQQSYRQAKGAMYLLAQRFKRTPQKHWPEVVAFLQGNSSTGLKLFNTASIPKSGRVTKSFIEGNLSWFEFDNDSEIFFLALEDSDQTLMIGPIPSENKVISLSKMSSATLIAVVIALALLCWLWPLLRNLKNIQRNALAFGQGDLNSRVQVSNNSIVFSLAESFNSMADSIQSLITTNQHLTNAVAHDLKTPLTRLRFALEMLDSEDNNENEKKTYRDNIESSIDTLDHLINQTLTHSHYNRLADIRNFSDCHFAYVVYDEFERFQFDHPELTFELSIDSRLEESKQFIVKSAMSRVLTNLLSNAVKYAQSSVKVNYFIKQGHSLNSRQQITLQVEDDGIGIAKENRQTVLKPYVQLDNTELDTSQGHGLGLAIVNRIAIWHKGQVRISRSSLGGASVDLSWPLLVKPCDSDEFQDDRQSIQVLS